jgi:uncharacterized protein (DUF2062 family)
MKGFFKKRLADPLIGFLLLGISPRKLALAVALGFTLAVFPVFGSTTILCALAAFVLRLNMPAIQLVNYFAYPLQFVLFVPFVRLGEKLFGAAERPISVTKVFVMFKTDVSQAVSSLWQTTVHAAAAWTITAIPFALVLYFILNAVFKKINLKSYAEKRG